MTTTAHPVQKGTQDKPFLIDPDEYLDYTADFRATTNGSDTDVADALQSGETIDTYSLTAQSGLTVNNASKTDSNTSITFWVNPDATTSGKKYVEVNVTTSAGRIFDRKVWFEVADR